jgi:hypothetical protein
MIFFCKTEEMFAYADVCKIQISKMLKSQGLDPAWNDWGIGFLLPPD